MTTMEADLTAANTAAADAGFDPDFEYPDWTNWTEGDSMTEAPAAPEDAATPCEGDDCPADGSGDAAGDGSDASGAAADGSGDASTGDDSGAAADDGSGDA